MREDALARIKSEFKLWGVKVEVTETGSGHYELRWRASPDKELRSYVIAKTASDWRAPLNNAAYVRRLFKQDGLTLAKPCEAKPKPALLAKALAIPEPVEKDADQIRMLRADVADLTEMVFELTAAMATMTKLQQSALLATIQQLPAIALPEHAPPLTKRSVRSIKTIDFVSDAWTSTDAIARDMGLSPVIAYRKLYYLLQKNIIELSGNTWRKRPPKQVAAIVAGTRTRKARSNGNGRHA